MKRACQKAICKISESALFMTSLEMVVRYGVTVIVLPVALNKLESTELAFFLFINTLMALAYLADSGFSQTIVRGSAYFRAGAVEIPERVTELSYVDTEEMPNWKAVGRLIATSNRIYLVIGLAATALLSTLGVAAAFNIITKQANWITAWLTYVLLILLSFFLLQVSRWSSLLQGLNQVASAKRIELVVGVARLFGIAAAMLTGFGVLGVVIVMIVSSLFSLIFTRLAVLRIIRDNGVCKEHITYDSEMLKRLWPSTWRMGAICWGSYLIYYGSSLIISQIPDPKQITSYLLTFQVVTLLYRFSSSPSLVYQPQVAAAVSNGDLLKVNQLTVKIMRYSLAIYIAGGLLVFFFAGDLLILIKSKSQLLDNKILLLLLVMYLLEMHHAIHAGIYMATNHIPFMIPSMISGVAIVISGFYSVHFWGVYGVVLSQIFVQAAFNNWYPVYLSLKIQKMSFASYMKYLLGERGHPRQGVQAVPNLEN